MDPLPVFIPASSLSVSASPSPLLLCLSLKHANVLLVA